MSLQKFIQGIFIIEIDAPMSNILNKFIFMLYVVPFVFAIKIEFFLPFILVGTYVLCYYLGVYAIGLECKKARVVDHSIQFNASRKLINILFIVYLCARYQQIADMIANFISGSYGDWALQNALDRYAYDEDPGVVWKFGTVAYVCLMTTMGTARKLISKKHLIFIFASFLIETSQLGRASTLIATAMLAVEYLIRSNKVFYNVSFKQSMKYGFFIILSMSVIFFTSAYMRLTDGDAVFEILIHKLLVYTIAMYQAFYAWMNDYNFDSIDLGFYTFTPIFKMFGYEVTQGLYPLVETDFGSTNIYTTLRGLVADFSIIGPCILFLFSGFYVKLMTHTKLNKINYFLLRFSILMMVYVIYSPFYFSTVFVGWMLSYVLVTKFNPLKVFGNNASRPN
jgi:oligosaccharide repeat unit polymerase